MHLLILIDLIYEIIIDLIKTIRHIDNNETIIIYLLWSIHNIFLILSIWNIDLLIIWIDLRLMSIDDCELGLCNL